MDTFSKLSPFSIERVGVQIEDAANRGSGEKSAQVIEQAFSATRTESKKRSKRSSIVDINGSGFDPTAADLWTTWSSFAPVIACVNSYPNGITVSMHTNRNLKRDDTAEFEVGYVGGEGSTVESRLSQADCTEPSRKFSPNQFHLRLRDTRDYQIPEGKISLFRENALRSLEQHLAVLHQKGVLATATVYFGTVSDPFLNYHKKFDVTSGCLELFERYQPGMLVVQTRSPMIVSALPVLRQLRERTVVVIPIESNLEKVIAHYTPGAPRISERLVTAEGLRRQGIKVNLCASPVLPYGDFYRDAWDFAEVLDRYADFVTLGCLATGTESDERQLKLLPIARKLAADKEFRWLRPHAHRYLHHALSVIAPQKLLLPVTPRKSVAQLSLFAA